MINHISKLIVKVDRRIDCADCVDCEKSDQFWGAARFYEDEPYGDVYVPICKGYEPCHYCWRGSLVKIIRGYFELKRKIKVSIDPRNWGRITEDEVPF